MVDKISYKLMFIIFVGLGVYPLYLLTVQNKGDVDKENEFNPKGSLVKLTGIPSESTILISKVKSEVNAIVAVNEDVSSKEKMNKVSPDIVIKTNSKNIHTTPVKLKITHKMSNDKSFDIKLNEKIFHSTHQGELHVIGVYEGDDGEKKEPWWKNCVNLKDIQLTIECHGKFASRKTIESVKVNAQLNKPTTLVLMAYEPVNWQIKSNKFSLLKQVILAGYEAQSITGLPSNVPVEIRTYNGSNTCINCTNVNDSFYVYDSASSKYTKTIKHIEDITGLSLTTFQSGYKKGSFAISKYTKRLDYFNDKPLMIYKPLDKEKFIETYEFDKYTLSLPEGNWSGLLKLTKQELSHQSEYLFLFSTLNNNLDKLFAVKLNTSNGSGGFEEKKICQTGVGYKSEVFVDKKYNQQLCYWVEHNTLPWQSSFLTIIKKKLLQKGIDVPEFVINSGFHYSNKKVALTQYYYSNPANVGIETSVSSWDDSSWHPSHYEKNEKLKAYISSLVNWSRNWFKLTRSFIDE